MPDIHVKAAGVYFRVFGLHVKSGGAWLEVKDAYVKIAGVWTKFYENRTGTDSNFNSSFIGVATAPLTTWNTDGTVDENDGGSGAYSTRTGVAEGDNWHVKFHKDSGTGVTNGSSEDVWHALSSARSKGIAAAGAGQVRSAIVSYEVSKDAGVTVHGSGTITLSSDRS